MLLEHFLDLKLIIKLEMNIFLSSFFTNEFVSFSLFNINSEEANQDYLSSKLAFETSSGDKKNIELSSQYKKARARLL